MKRIVVWSALTLLIAVGLVYVADYGVLHYRIWRNLSPYDSVTVQVYYAIQEKNQRTEYVYDSTQQRTCANSWFPHLGYAPCWYLRRHTDQSIPI